MANDEIKKGLAGAVKQFANPQAIAVATISQVLGSNYTKETIRKLLIDPVTKRFIPSRHYYGLESVTNVIWTIYKLFPKFFKEKLMDNNDVDQSLKDIEMAWEKSYKYQIGYEITLADTVYIISTHSGVIYLRFDVTKDREGYNKYNSAHIHFITINPKFTETWDTAFESVKSNFSAEGYKAKYKNTVRVVNMKNGGDGRSPMSRCTVPKTIIMDHVENELSNIISMVEKSDTISNVYELNKTIGVLLYGPHGTGKSTIARYLAAKLDRVLVLTTAETLSDAIDWIKRRSTSGMKFIILIEDIDFHFVDRRREVKNSENEKSMADTELLFQLLDGVLADSNIMVIATTNYIERLDPALIRDGRFDFRIEVLGLTKDEAKKVCTRFDVNPDDIHLESWLEPISPASLQTYLLKFKTGSMNDLKIPDPVSKEVPEESKKTSKKTEK